MDICVAGNASEHFQLRPAHIQVVAEPFGRMIDMKPFSQFFILGGNADRTLSCVADTLLLAGSSYKSSRRDRHGICTHGQCFRKIPRKPESSGDDQIHGKMMPVQIFSGSGQCKDRRDGSVVL